jgi:radical SAM superfamily enzyme YgiQ (UPF0313 family)
VVAFDREGRPQSWLVGGRTYKRSLASEIFGRRSEGGTRRRWRVPEEDARAHFARARSVAAAAMAALERGELRRSAGRAARPLEAAEADALRERLARALAWTPERLREERRRFAAAYRPLSILPPDQYRAVVLQATHGCTWNRCTFCTFYQDRPFAVRDPEDFARHVDAVAELLGADLPARGGVFLADGNALVLSNRRLGPLFEAARSRLPGRPVQGFVDVYGGERKPTEDWRELRSWGLERVAIGVETGSDALLAYLNKPGGADDAVAFARALKEAGLALSIILMVGAGGRAFEREHERDTRALIQCLPLGAGDRVYLSPFQVQPGSRYAERAREDGVEPLDPGALRRQYDRLREAARAAAPAATVALYHIDEFVY